MCGRFYIASEDTAEELRTIIDTLQRKTGMQMKTGEIRPTDITPAIANNRELKPAPFAMKWGFTLPNGKPIINARSETAMEKPLFREGMERRRCLIPATLYYEWEQVGKQKVKNEIRPASSSVMYMAGVYRFEQGKPVYTILTKEPAECIRHIHDRMPVILPRDICGDWLNLSYHAHDVLKAAVEEVEFRPEVNHLLIQ